MTKRKKIAFDLSAFLWHSLLTGKDHENGFKAIHKEKEVWINSRFHGYDICLKAMLDVMDHYKLTPIDMILVPEGEGSKAKRLMLDKDYKQGREHPTESYAEFIAVRDEIKKDFLERGAQALTQKYAEGDDVLAWLAQNTEDDLIIATFDNDISALNGTNAYGANVVVWVNGQDGGNKYGMFDHHLITTYKALVGDSSDNIKGCPGFGPVKFDMLIAQYGYDGLQEMHDMLMAGDLSPIAGCDKKSDPLLVMISDNAPQVLKCFDLARLRPGWVDTVKDPIQWEAGMVRQYDEVADKLGDPRMSRWLGRARLVGADTFAQAVEWATPHILASHDIALDIETSTPDESSEWLERQGDIDGVDVFGSYLVGLGLTFGRNNQYTLYFNVKHADRENNIDSELVRQFIASIPQDKRLIIQNVSFELAVLFNEWGDRQLDNGYRGFLPNVLDTKFEASYVDENSALGLKQRSKSILGYTQQTYEETTRLTMAPADLPFGGRWVSEKYKTHLVGTGKFEQVPLVEDEACYLEPGYQPTMVNGPEIMREEFVLVGTGQFETRDIVKKGKVVGTEEVEVMERVVETETRQYKMHELTGAQVFGYGADDPICTIALHNYYRLRMQMEHTWKVYEKVEIHAAYANAHAFISGIPFSMERMLACEARDKEAVSKAWPVLRDFLIKSGWEGTVPPNYTVDISAAEVKDAFAIVTGERLDTQMRTISKMAVFAAEQPGGRIFGELLARVAAEKTPEAAAAFNKYVLDHFKGEPVFNADSPVQMKRFLYEVLGLPVRLTNKLTDVQRAKGETQGTAKTDDLALQHALHFDKDKADLSVLEAIQTIKQCGTRTKLYYKPYRGFPHWKDGMLHPSTNQCATVTRRNSASAPNYTQWPGKGEGLHFRECIVPRGPKRVIISSDASGQELRLTAELSQDTNMLSCYIGDNLRDIHSIVAAAATKYFLDRQWTYDEFYAALKGIDKDLADAMDVLRSKSKTVNFAEIYGAAAKSVSEKLLISEEEAQRFLDAKKAQFPGVDEWKEDVVRQARRIGYSETMLGARRHMRNILVNGDKWEVSKAERQLSNYCIQGSGAEAIKIALGKCVLSELMQRCDVHIIGSIHDEIVLDCPEEFAYEVARELVKFLEAKYANMEVPFVSETTIGLDFGYQLKLPYGFNKEQVEVVLAKMHAEAAERKVEKKAA